MLLLVEQLLLCVRGCLALCTHVHTCGSGAACAKCNGTLYRPCSGVPSLPCLPRLLAGSYCCTTGGQVMWDDVVTSWSC